MNANPSLDVVKMQARIANLEIEVSTLRGLEPKVTQLRDLIMVWDQDVAAQDQAIAEER
jgi:hypothetical protein